MSNITVDSTFGEAVTGLKLEPSGFLFSKPIKIYVTLENTDNSSPVFFFMTDELGNITGIPDQKHEKNNYTIEVTHFSGLVGLVPNNIENLCMISKNATSVSISKAAGLLTSNPRITTKPLSFERQCDEGYSRLLSANISQMMEPERSAIRNILSCQRGVALSCNFSNIMELQLPEEVHKLSDQLVTKALNAIAEYKNQPDKYAALGQFAMIACNENSLLCSPNAKENRKKVLEALTDWLKNNIRFYKKKIAEEHDLQYFRTLTDCYAELALLAPEIYSSNTTIQELENLFRFDLEIEVHVYRDSQGPDWTLSEYTITKGVVNMVFDFSFYEKRSLYPSPNYSHKLIGTGKFSTEGKAVKESQGEPSTSIVIPDAFEKKYEVQLNLCTLTGETVCVFPGNKNEAWEGDEFIN
jgi:hypothetical protein